MLLLLGQSIETNDPMPLIYGSKMVAWVARVWLGGSRLPECGSGGLAGPPFKRLLPGHSFLKFVRDFAIIRAR